ncbi:DUF4258 domain-containing protein [Methylococcus sp. Mc7]|uniref:DUF4258 domain-containing protein n=1 Tax=Methylococcus sp. Mc7 TaxID=2860258 RepID=UPI001C530CD1|nr:DUF4258 domain-containing protein [Methylococcus sp. Mc7]QXP82856.1 DUF4258 domain-containing protein [Methylococcus sp. Mc7]
MNYELTEHARESLSKRAIQTEWLERVLLQPQRVEADRMDAALQRRLVRIDEYGGSYG